MVYTLRDYSRLIIYGWALGSAVTCTHRGRPTSFTDFCELLGPRAVASVLTYESGLGGLVRV